MRSNATSRTAVRLAERFPRSSSPRWRRQERQSRGDVLCAWIRVQAEAWPELERYPELPGRRWEPLDHEGRQPRS